MSVISDQWMKEKIRRSKNAALSFQANAEDIYQITYWDGYIRACNVIMDSLKRKVRKCQKAKK